MSDGPNDRELETVIAQLQRLGARLVALGHGRDPRSRRAAGRFAAAWSARTNWEGDPNEIAVSVDWPAEGASWLKQARRFGDAPVDAWVVADDGSGWSGMCARLLASTQWSPSRTVAFSGLDRIASGEAFGGLDGMVGATADGGLWFFEEGDLVVHRPKAQDVQTESLLPRPPLEVAPGAVHIPGWLDLDRQQELVAHCREWAAGPAPMRHSRLPNGAKMSVQTVCLGWHWTPYRYTREAIDQGGAPVTPFPDWLVDLGRAAVADAYGDPAAAAGYRPDAALVNFYDHEAKLGMHQDKDEVSLAPVVSLSIGDSCVFRLGNTQSRGRPYTDVELVSGDLFVFGGPSRLAFHGVPKVVPGTAPPSLGLASGRLNMTLRETGLVD